ncbi:type IV secretion system protein [Candidatus Enterovibrio escicola]|uniref:type IV secretion system protein n=1 Tax=Candidatus Enterovibrio escicola TaxID=1927127 RepID=UPI001237B71D|nr:type IV secretion system protein [Candidatus Enterovibrio escacola]
MFDTLFKFIDQIVTTNIASMVGVFSSTITPLLGACVILYALYLAYQSLYEPHNLIIMESVKFIGSLSVVTFISLNTSWYLANIVPAVLGSGDQIAQALLGSPSGGGGASLQIMFKTVVDNINVLYSQISIELTSLKTWMSSLLIFLQIFILILGFIPFFGVATAYLLITKIMVSFLLIIGPLFIMLAFFPSTRSFFQAWTGQCFNYTLLSIMYPLAFTMFTQVLVNTVFTKNLSIQTHLMTVILFAALTLLSIQIPTFCSTLSGGIGINGLIGGAVSGLRGIKSLGKGLGTGAKGAYKGRKVAGEWAKNLGKGNIKPG